MDGEQVRGCFELWSCLLTGVGAAGVFCCRHRCPLRRSCQPRQALSKPKMSPLGGLPHGSQVGPSQVDGTSSCDKSFTSQQGSCSPVFGLLCSSVSGSCSRALAQPPVLASRLPIHTRHFLVPKVPVPQTWWQWLFSLASGFDAGGSLGQGWCSGPTSSAPPCLCALMLKGETSPMPVFSAMPASLKGSGAPGLPRRIGESSNADVPPDFSRVSTSGSGFQHSRQRLVVHHSEAVRSPSGFSCVRVSSGSDRTGVRVRVKDKDDEF